jgi:exopolyphosphatase/guanosine-5'-triphosphate,3'-diphosphate pyrophosphatase
MLARVDRSPRDAAVIDIGSNSIRLVLYRLEGRAVWTVFNEKVLAGLGRDLPQTGRLSPEGVEAALAALRRFRTVLDALEPAEVFVAATAAVREAADGREFVAEVLARTGLEARILTGEEEARLSALGVAAGIPKATGVAGDLGGFSLELVCIDEGQPGEGATLALGPFALGAGQGTDIAAVRKEAARRMAGLSNRFAADTLYAIGGAWRNLALLHMRMTDYPLQIVHQYEMSAKDALQTSHFIASQSRSSLERMEGLSRKRAESMPFAALVLELLIEKLGLRRIIVSAWGLREGLLFDSLPAAVQALDPLIEGAAGLGARQPQAESLGAALEDWIEPVFSALEPVFEPEREPVLRAAACRLADLGARLHPDHRADLVFDQVLRAPAPGMDHTERAFLAAAAFSRHTAANVVPGEGVTERLLTYERLQRARALGAALRLGCDLSARSPALLAKSRLKLDEDSLVLSAERDGAELLLGEQIAKRAATLATSLGRGLAIRAD